MATAPDPVDATRHWLQHVVIGLNLCPFAKAVHARNQVRYVLSNATTPDALLEELTRELEFLHAADPDMIDTTLLIHPQVLEDFLDYNDFLDVADDALEVLGLEGEFQIASFHPDYQFEGSAPDAIENCTNRSPHPMLHLLREDSVERAVAAYPDPDAIVQRNLKTLRRLGIAGFNKLLP